MNTVICGMSIYNILWYFVIYSFIGWCIEVVFHAMKAHRLVNRGFLNGPVCPVYGFGVVLVFAAVNVIMEAAGGSYQEISVFVLFPVGVLLTTSVELIGGYFLDVAFHAHWWNYSKEKFNFKGYICLKFSLMWGLGVVLLVKLAHPLIKSSTISLIPEAVGIWIIVLLCIAYFADFVVSVLITLELNRNLEELDRIQKEMRRLSNQITKVVAGGSIAAEVILDTQLTKAGLVKEDTMHAVLDQASKSGGVIDNKTYTDEFKETGVPVQAGVQVEADVKEALTERKDEAVAAITEKRDETVAAITEKRDEAVAAITEKRDEAVAAITEKRDEAVAAITEKRDEAVAAITEKRDEAVAAIAEKRDGAMAVFAEKKDMAQESVGTLLSKESLEARLEVLRKKSIAVSSRMLRHRVFGPLRILKAFPRFTHNIYNEALDTLRSRSSELTDPGKKGTDNDNNAA